MSVRRALTLQKVGATARSGISIDSQLAPGLRLERDVGRSKRQKSQPTGFLENASANPSHAKSWGACVCS